MLPFSRFEARTIFKLSGPIVLAQLTQTLMYFVDTVMAGRVSATDMAAIAVASGLWLPVMLTLQGLLLALTPIIAQYFGSKQTEPVTHYSVQGLYLGLALAAMLFVLMQFADLLLFQLNMEAELLEKTSLYLKFVSYGLFPAAGYMVMRNLFEGIGNTKASMYISFVGILVNVPANYIFIYGKLGMPAYGGAGCGIATSLVFLAMFIAMLIYGWFSRTTAPYRNLPKRLLPELKAIWQIVRIGTPIALSIFFEVTLFACIPLMIVHLGSVVVAGHQVAHNYSAIVFMIPLSLGMAATIRVGHLVGEKNIQGLRTAISTILIIALLLSLGIATFSYTMRHIIPAIYSTDPEVLALAASIMVLAALYQISDAIQVVSACALRGMKITTPVLYITLIAYWPIGFGLGCVLGLTDWLVPAMGVTGFWIGIIVGLTVAAVLLFWLLQYQLRRFEHNDAMANKGSVTD